MEEIDTKAAVLKCAERGDRPSFGCQNIPTAHFNIAALSLFEICNSDSVSLALFPLTATLVSSRAGSNPIIVN